MISCLFFVDGVIFFFKAKEEDMRSLLDVLELYDCMTGQWINFEKSSIMFSPSVLRDTKGKLVEISNIQQVALKEKYLGLPIRWEKPKTTLFNI